MIHRVSGWRTSEVLEEGEVVSSHNTAEMGWCAATQLRSYGARLPMLEHAVDLLGVDQV